jgi:hypothetical protein
MPTSNFIASIYQWLKKALLISVIFLLVLLILISSSLIVLPHIVSSPKFCSAIESKISSSLNRPVSINHLSWSWSKGIIIKNLVISEKHDASPAQQLVLTDARLDIKIREFLKPKVIVNLETSGLDINIIRYKDGTLNIGPSSKSSIAEKEKPSAKTKIPEKKIPGKKTSADQQLKKPFSLPIDIVSHINLENISVVFNDNVSGQSYAVLNTKINFKMPSLINSPLSLLFETDIVVNGQTLPPSSLNLTLENLFDRKRQLNVSGLKADLFAIIPGSEVRAQADMSTSGIDSKVHLDLKQLIATVAPLVSSDLSSSNLDGKIDLIFQAAGQPDKPVLFDAKLTASKIAVSGNIIGGKTVGPGNFGVAVSGSCDLKNEAVELKTANINILKNSHIKIFGNIDRFNTAERFIDLTVSPMYLDLNELTQFIQPFIPELIEIVQPENTVSTFSIKNLNIKGAVGDGQTDVNLDQLKLHIPSKISVRQPTVNQEIVLAGLLVTLKDCTTELLNLFPDRISLSGAFSLNELISKKDDQIITIKSINLNRLVANTNEINKAENKFGLSSQLNIENNLSIEKIEIPEKLHIKSLAQSLKTDVKLDTDDSLSVDIKEFLIKVPALSIQNKETGDINTGVDMALFLPSLSLQLATPFNFHLNDIDLSISLEDALSLKLNAEEIAYPDSNFLVTAILNSDLDKLFKKLPDRTALPLDCYGDLNIKLFAKGRLPQNQTIKELAANRFKGNLDFLEKLEFESWINNGNMSIKQKNNDNISIGSITGKPLLKYTLIGKSGKGDMSGHLLLDKIQGLPSIDSSNPLSAEFTISGSHLFASSINFHQKLESSPVQIIETVDIDFEGLDKLLRNQSLSDLSMWLSKINSTVTVGFEIPDCRLLKDSGIPGLADTDISGRINANADLTLIANRSLEGNTSLLIGDMNLEQKNKLTIANIATDIDLRKSYRIIPIKLLSEENHSNKLSQNIIKSAMTKQQASGDEASDINLHLRSISERLKPVPEISIDKISISSGAFPITIGNTQIMLDLNNGLPNFDFFRLDALDGAVNGSISLQEEKNYFVLKTNINFTGLNTAAFFPEAFSKEDKSKAEISGSLFAEIPVTDDLNEILENLNSTIEFSKIGSRALERIMYALDPYESNEAIVAQRRLLRNGSPKKIRVDVSDGFLTMRGDVSIKGITIELPTLRRLNIAQIPGIEKFDENLKDFSKIVSIMEKVSADKLIIGSQGGPPVIFE